MSLRKNAVRPDWDEPLLTTLNSVIEAAGGLAVVAYATGDRVPAGLINAGLLEHPVTKAPAIVHVAYGDSRRVARLAEAANCTFTWHDGRKWLAAEGKAELVFGPWDDRASRNDPRLALGERSYLELLRAIYASAGGGEHPNWSEFDATMRDEKRVAVLVSVDRLYGIHWDGAHWE